MQRKSKVILICCLLLGICILIAAFFGLNHVPAMEDTNKDNFQNDTGATKDNHQTANQKEYFRVSHDEMLFYCEFYDSDHNVIRTEGPFSREPHVIFVDDILIRFTIQAGTGKGTQWGYYYNTETACFSETFQSIFDEDAGIVAYAKGNKVVVRDIFDKEIYYQEFQDFSYSFSQVVEPFVAVRLDVNAKQIEITYLSGPNYEKITDIFEL